MRLTLIIWLALILTGCSDERTQVVADYLQQRNEGTDIQITIKKFSQLKKISAGDSLDILVIEYERKKERFMRGYIDLMLTSQALKNNIAEKQRIQSEINGMPLNADPADSSTQRLVWIDALEKRAVEGNTAAMIYKQKQLVELRKIAGRIKRYEENPNAILATTARVTYSIKNTLADKAELVTKTIVFSPDGKRVLSVRG